jgi:hypothetical protein
MPGRAVADYESTCTRAYAKWLAVRSSKPVQICDNNQR